MEGSNARPPIGLLHRTFTGFFWVLLGSGIQVALKIAVLAVLARLVTPGDFGLIGVAVIVIDFSRMFTHMGVGPALIQRQAIEPRHLTTGLTLSLLLGVLFTGMLLLTAPFIASFFRMPYLTPILSVLSVTFLIDSFTLIAQALLQRNMKFRTYSTIEVVSYAVGYGGVGIVMGYLGWGVWAMVTASLAQAFLLTVLLLIVQPFPKKLGFDAGAFSDLMFFGGGFTLARIANFLATQGDNMMVGRLLGASALGIYGRAYQFMVMPAGLFGNALDRALFPAMAKIQSDHARVGRAYLTGVATIALIALPISVLSFFLAPEIVMVLLGPDWSEVTLPFQILACSLVFRMGYKMSDSLARATGAVYRRAWRQVIYAAMVIGGTYVGHHWGLPGVALGVAIALMVNFLFMAHLSLQLAHLRWHEIVKAHKPGLLLGIMSGILTHVIVSLCRAYDMPDILTLALTTAGVGIVLLVMMIYFPALIITMELRTLYDKLITRRVKNLFPKNA